jgi:hypothetical protein
MTHVPDAHKCFVPRHSEHDYLGPQGHGCNERRLGSDYNAGCPILAIFSYRKGGRPQIQHLQLNGHSNISLPRPNPNHAHHPSRVPLRGAMREEQIPLAIRTPARRVN